MLISEIRVEGRRPPFSSDIIAKVKSIWDENKEYLEICNILNLKKHQVDRILKTYYPDRKKRVVVHSPKDIAYLKQLHDDGTSYKEISELTGYTKDIVYSILARYYPEREKRGIYSPPKGIQMNDAIRMGNRYSTGQGIRTIAKDYNVNPTVIYYWLKKLPNFNDLRNNYLANRDSYKKEQSTTKIHRAGTMDNKKSKGPQTKHTQGVNWPKYGE